MDLPRSLVKVSTGTMTAESVMVPIKMLCCQLRMMKWGSRARAKGLLHHPQHQPLGLLQPSHPAESSGPPEEANRKCLYNAHCHKVQTTHRGSGHRITDGGMLVSPWNMTIQTPFICSTNIWGFYTSQESQQWRKHIQRAREEAEK